MKLTALVPMKGNSERVRNKNLKSFNGKPLFHTILNSLIKSKYIDKVAINTDSEKIAKDTKENFGNIVVINRPKNIQGDFVSMNLIICYDLSQLTGEHFIQTHSTNPLVSVRTFDRGIKTYFDSSGRFDSLFSVTRMQTRLYGKNAIPLNHNPKELLRTQDLEPLYEENSNFYIFSKTSFKNAGNNRIGLKPKMFEVNRLEAVDIDEPEDFILAESLIKQGL